RLRGRLLSRAIQLEERLSLGDRTAKANVDFGHASGRLGNDRNGSVERRHAARRGMVVKDHRNQGHRENEASRYAPPQLEPHRVQRYFAPQALALDISAVEIIGYDRQQGTEKKLKHGSAPFCSFECL